MDNKDFLECLFNKGERVAYGETFNSVKIAERDGVPTTRFFCINPVSDGRKASDLTAYRNLLIEIDTMSIEQQSALIQKIGLPYSTRVYSGNKSDHYVIALENGVDKETYKMLVDYTHNIIKEADHATKPANKLSRFPNAMRPETGKKQELIEIKSRVSESTFMSWLNQYPDCKPVLVEKPVYANNDFSDWRANIVKWVDWYINDFLGIPFNGGEIKVQCPICAQVGRDNHKDNMYVYGPERKHTCFASPEHNALLTKELRSLYFAHR